MATSALLPAASCPQDLSVRDSSMREPLAQGGCLCATGRGSMPLATFHTPRLGCSVASLGMGLIATITGLVGCCVYVVSAAAISMADRVCDIAAIEHWSISNHTNIMHCKHEPAAWGFPVTWFRSPSDPAHSCLMLSKRVLDRLSPAQQGLLRGSHAVSCLFKDMDIHPLLTTQAFDESGTFYMHCQGRSLTSSPCGVLSLVSNCVPVDAQDRPLPEGGDPYVARFLNEGLASSTQVVAQGTASYTALTALPDADMSSAACVCAMGSLLGIFALLASGVGLIYHRRAIRQAIGQCAHRIAERLLLPDRHLAASTPHSAAEEKTPLLSEEAL